MHGALVGARRRDRVSVRRGALVACGVSLLAAVLLLLLLAFVLHLVPEAQPLPDVGLRFERSGLVLLKRMAEPRYRFHQMDLEWLSPMRNQPIHVRFARALAVCSSSSLLSARSRVCVRSRR